MSAHCLGVKFVCNHVWSSKGLFGSKVSVQSMSSHKGDTLGLVCNHVWLSRGLFGSKISVQSMSSHEGDSSGL